jgi:molybdenum cofactor cytidylyltransferase
MPPRVAALVLAAGRSSRMGRTKALLPDRDGVPFVVRIARTLVDAGAAPVMVIVRPETHEAIRETLAELCACAPVSVLVNGDPERGQLSSLLTGLDSAGDVDGMLVTLVDVPFLSSDTVRAVIAAWTRERAPIVRPARGHEHGHPVLFDCRTFDVLRHAPLSEGAKPVVRGYGPAIVNVPVDDDGAFVDLDTPDEYAGALSR